MKNPHKHFFSAAFSRAPTLQTERVQAIFDWEQQSKSRYAACCALKASVHNFKQGMQGLSKSTVALQGSVKSCESSLHSPIPTSLSFWGSTKIQKGGEPMKRLIEEARALLLHSKLAEDSSPFPQQELQELRLGLSQAQSQLNKAVQQASDNAASWQLKEEQAWAETRSAKKGCVALEQRLSAQQAENSRLASRSAGFQARAKQSELQLQGVQYDLDCKTAEMAALHIDLRGLQQQTQAQDQAILKMRSKMENQDSSIDSLNNALSEQRASNSQEKAALIGDTTQQLADLRSHHAELQVSWDKQLMTVKAENAQLRQDAKHQQTALEALQHNLAVLKADKAQIATRHQAELAESVQGWKQQESICQALQVEGDKHKSAASSMIRALCNDKRALADDLTAQVTGRATLMADFSHKLSKIAQAVGAMHSREITQRSEGVVLDDQVASQAEALMTFCQAQQAKGHSTTKQLAGLKANLGRSEAAKKALEGQELELRRKLAAQAGTVSALQADVAAKTKLADDHAHFLSVQANQIQELVADNGSLKKQCEGHLKALEAFKLRGEEGLTLHPLSNPAADRACSPATSPTKPDYQGSPEPAGVQSEGSGVGADTPCPTSTKPVLAPASSSHGEESTTGDGSSNESYGAESSDGIDNQAEQVSSLSAKVGDDNKPRASTLTSPATQSRNILASDSRTHSCAETSCGRHAGDEQQPSQDYAPEQVVLCSSSTWRNRTLARCKDKGIPSSQAFVMVPTGVNSPEHKDTAYFWQKLECLREAGKGGFAAVKYCERRIEQKPGSSAFSFQPVAVKIVAKNLQSRREQSALRIVQKELQKTPGPHHLTTLVESFARNANGVTELYIITKFEEGAEVGKAFERLHERYKERQGQEKQQVLEEIVSAAATTLKQVLQGLALLHKQGILHGDVKDDNVMVTMREDGSQPHAVLVDFGSTMSFKQKCCEVICGTSCCPPEVRGSFTDPTTTPVTSAVDIWGAGCLLFEMLADYCPFGPRHGQASTTSQSGSAGKPLSENEKQKRQLVKEQHRQWADEMKNGKLPKQLQSLQQELASSARCAQAVDLLLHMLQMTPAARWKIDQILAHQFFQ